MVFFILINEIFSPKLRRPRSNQDLDDPGTKGIPRCETWRADRQFADSRRFPESNHAGPSRPISSSSTVGGPPSGPPMTIHSSHTAPGDGNR